MNIMDYTAEDAKDAEKFLHHLLCLSLASSASLAVKRFVRSLK